MESYIKHEHIRCSICSGYWRPALHYLGFPDSSVGKESTCNAEDPGSIPGSGRSPGEGIGYPLQYSWASLVAQLVKNLPAMLETWVRSLGLEDPLEKGKAIHSSILAWRIPILFMGSQRVGYYWVTFTFTPLSDCHMQPSGQWRAGTHWLSPSGFSSWFYSLLQASLLLVKQNNLGPHQMIQL